MPSADELGADELRANVAAARTVLRAAIATAADSWETPKGTAADGEAGWSPRQAAEHAIPSELMFTDAICAACGYDGPENPLDGEPSFASAADALAALDAVIAAADSKVDYVQDEELGKTTAAFGFEAVSVAWLMEMDVWHLADHSAQMISPMG